MATSDVTITSTLLPTSAISATPSTDGLLTATSPITSDISTTSSSTTNGMLTITTGGYPEISTITTGGYPEISTTLLTTNTTFPVTTSSLPANLTASTPHNNALAIGLGVGIPCGVLLLVAIAFLIYFLIKHKKPMSPHNTKTEEIPTTENQYETVMPRVRKPNDYVNISFDPYETAPDEPLYERTLNIN
ncbi:cell wall protein DAN4 isoform X17 [Xenopus tropicalis]|uniref:Cell wall protein DAN4 isoform X17 n=1 Tax=Xenopus tropicalis TaxID=8364 RepID=A0A8J1JVM1_XENTR|nr:cell wall protein DAN4 isoform X17 [Xenopus tropicalis]